MASLPSVHLQLVPHTEQWITRKQFLDFSTWTPQWLRNQIRVGNIRTRETTHKLANGWYDIEFAVSSLPPKARERYEAAHRSVETQEPAQLTLAAFAVPRSVAAAPRVLLSEAAANEAAAKLDLLTPLLDWINHNPKPRGLRLQDGSDVRTQGQMVTWLCEQHAGRFSEATIWRWLREYRKGGEAALAKKPRKDAGQNWFTANPKAAYVAVSLYLGDGFTPGAASVQAVMRTMEQQCDLLDLTPADLPSPDTLRRFLATTPKPLATLAREGRKKFGELHLPYVRRSYAEHANEIWVSDHMIADVEVLNDCFHDLPFGAPLRMRLTCILDWRSRYVVAHTWCVEGSSVSLGAAMAQAVRRHGPCELFYCDNGKDYIKFANGATPGYLRNRGPQGWAKAELDSNAGMLARLGIHVNHAIPHHPQSKHIERFFNTVHSQFCSLWQTYTAGKPCLRPDSTAALMSIHRKLLRSGQVQHSMHPTATQLAAAFEAWLDEYHARPHGGEGMDERSPAEVFVQERNPAQKPAPPLEQLILASCEHDTRVVRETSIELFGTRYLPANDHASAQLFLRNGRTVHIAYDRLDPEFIAVLDDAGYVLCMLRIEQLLRMSPDDEGTQAQIAASMQQRGMLTRMTREMHDTATQARRAIGVRTPAEMLNTKALPAVVPDQRVTQRAAKPQRLAKVASDADAQPRKRAYAADLANDFLTTLSGGSL